MDLSTTIHLLGDILGQVISEQESQRAFELEELVRMDAKARRSGSEESGTRLAERVKRMTIDQARVIASAFTLYFDLVNLAEENYRVELLRQLEKERDPVPLKDSIAEAVAILKSHGVSPGQLQSLMKRLKIELVLTAHPTEAKRRTILSKMERIANILLYLDHPDLLPREVREFRDQLYAEITGCWLTERARSDRPGVTDEVRTGLYFVERVFWQVLPQIYSDLEKALEQHYPEVKAPNHWLGLASWIGGDRDGNPYVTAEVTAETLRLHRGLAVEQHRKSFQDLARWLSVSARRAPPPPELTAWFESRRPLPPHVAFLENRYSHEPYRLILSLLADDLAEASRDEMAARLLSSPVQGQARISIQHLTLPLKWIGEAVPRATTHSLFSEIEHQVNIFGLHAARLDLREDSSRLNEALGEILRALNLDEGLMSPDADLQARTDLFIRLLEQERPLLSSRPGVTPQAAETWALFELAARARQLYGNELFGPFIISMTRSPADVLAVLLMAGWAGCADGLQIAPLFETLTDLEAAPQILDALFSIPAYRAHLATCNDEQVIMIGYSDSNKDGGYLAANWALYQAQENIARVCRQNQVVATIFHGRGGTVARGGGPAHRAIRSQPPHTIEGRFRLTEQGEIIAARYSNPFLAHRHLEQIVSAVLLASSPNQEAQARVEPAWREAMTEMSRVAWKTYRRLVFETPGFLAYWQSVTPLSEIKRLLIGSRPAARGTGGDGIEKIRAIPWVFSWLQSRFNLPGWYGLGSALDVFRSQLPVLQDMFANWQFFRSLLENAEMSLLKADMQIAGMYSKLMPDQDLAAQIYSIILREYEITCEMILLVSGHKELMESEAVVQRAVQLRNPYIDPLNFIQVEMLRRLRSLSSEDGPEAQDLHQVIVMTINGIAAGLRNTG